MIERHCDFFTTEDTEEKLRATEYYNFFGEQRAPRKLCVARGLQP